MFKKCKLLSSFVFNFGGRRVWKQAIAVANTEKELFLCLFLSFSISLSLSPRLWVVHQNSEMRRDQIRTISIFFCVCSLSRDQLVSLIEAC